MDYKELFEKVTSIVNDVDPMGLVGGGAPPDEYSGEVSKVLVELQKTSSEDDLCKRLKGIFVDLNDETYQVLAKKLILLKE